MASVVGQASAAATSVAIPAHQPGDMILVSARGTVAPSIPAAAGTVPAWTTLQSSAQFSIGLTTVGFIATASNHTTGVFTNATHIGVVVVRAGSGKKLAIGASATGGANNSTSLIYPALTLQVADGSSFGVRIGTRVTAATQLATNMPTSWTKQIEQPATTAAMVVCTRAALAANPVADTVTAGAANAAYRAHTVEVRELTPATVFGAVSVAVTFGRTVSGQRKTFSSLSLPIAYSAFVDGQASTAAQTYYGAVASSWQFGASSSGQRKTFGQIGLPLTFAKDVKGQRKTFGQLQSPLIFGKAVAGQRKTFGQIAFPINAAIAIAGSRVGLTLYGALALPITFNKDIRGQRKTFGQVTMPLRWTVVDIQHPTAGVAGIRTTFGRIDFPIIFTKEAVGRKNVFGQLSMQTLFGKEVSGWRKTFGQLALPITFSKEISGRRKTFGQIAIPIGFTAFVNGQGVTGAKTFYGQLALPIVFSKQVVAHRKTFGQITAPFVFGSASQGRRRTHGRIALPIVVGLTTAGKIVTTGVGIILNLAESLYLGEQVVDAAFVGDEKVWPSGFDPLSISGLSVWFDAADYEPGLWPNKGAGPQPVISTPRPTISVNQKNGLPVVRFKINEGTIRLTGTGITYDYTLVYVARVVGPNPGRVISAQYPNGGNLLYGWWTTQMDVAYSGAFFVNLSGANPAITTTPLWKLYSGDCGSDRVARLFSNGAFLSHNPATIEGFGGTFNISGYGYTTEETGDYEVAEVLLYNRRLPVLERQQVEAYLREKWGM